MKLKSFLFILLILILAISCNSKETKTNYEQVLYRAVNGKDTAILALNISKERFYGRYEIVYHRIGKDSGDVRGDIKGDTFRGDYHYISNGGSWKRIPLAFQREKNKLISGTGVIGTYMNLPCFLPGTLTYEDPKFIFEEVDK